MLLVSVICLWLLVSLNFWRFHDWLYPALIHSVLWLGLVTGFWATSESFYPIHDNTLAILLLGVISFSLGSFSANLGHRANTQCLRFPEPIGTSLWLFLLSACAGLPFYLQRATLAASLGLSDSFLANIRDASGDWRSPFLILMWVAYVALAVSCVRYFSKPDNKRRRILIFAVIVALGYAIPTGSRNQWLAIGAIFFGVPLSMRCWKPLKTAAVIGCIASVLFLGYTVVLVSVTGLKGAASAYLVGSVPAFDQVVSRNNAELEMGRHSFRTAILWAHDMGLAGKPRTIEEPYVGIGKGLQANIYTANLPMYMDFGWAGVGIFQFALGVVHGFLYRKLTSPTANAPIVIWFSLLMFPLIFQTVTDSYLTDLTKWLEFIVLVWLVIPPPLMLIGRSAACKSSFFGFLPRFRFVRAA